jgi:hypothetical protein
MTNIAVVIHLGIVVTSLILLENYEELMKTFQGQCVGLYCTCRNLWDTSKFGRNQGLTPMRMVDESAVAQLFLGSGARRKNEGEWTAAQTVGRCAHCLLTGGA